MISWRNQAITLIDPPRAVRGCWGNSLSIDGFNSPAAKMKFLYDLKDRFSYEACWQGYPKLGTIRWET